MLLLDLDEDAAAERHLGLQRGESSVEVPVDAGRGPLGCGINCFWQHERDAVTPVLETKGERRAPKLGGRPLADMEAW